MTQHSQVSAPAVDRLHWVCIAAIAIASWSVYVNALGGVFLFDDHHVIVNDEAVANSVFDPGHLRSQRPLTQITFAFSAAMSGMTPYSFHLFNNAVHTLAAVVLFLWIDGALRRRSFGVARTRSVAFFASLLWAVHPLNTQAVTYIVQRSESMAGLALFLFLLALHKAAAARRPAGWLAGAAVVFFAGCACKQHMVMALPVGLLFDRLFLSSSWKQVFRQRGWFWGLCCGVILLVAIKVVPTILFSGRAAGFGVESVSPTEYARTQPGVLLYYVRLVLIPYPLVFDYGWPVENRIWFIAVTSIALFVIVAISLRTMRGEQPWGFWPLAALLMLVPTSSIMPILDIAVEHRMYASSAFLLTLLVLLLCRACEAYMRPRVSAALLASAAVCLAVMTVHRNGTYLSEIGMWQDVVRKSPENWRGHHYVGLELSKSDPREAIKHYGMSAKLNPMFPDTWFELGILHKKVGALEHSEKSFHNALRLMPDNADYYANLGVTQAMMSRSDSAEASFTKALSLDPQNRVALCNLGLLRSRQGRDDQAIELLRRAVKHHPKDADCHLNLGVAMKSRGELAEAGAHMERAVRLNPGSAEAHYNLGTLYAISDLTRALRHLRQAIKIAPGLSMAHNNLAALLEEQDPRQALYHYAQALRADPGNATAKRNLNQLRVVLEQQ